MWSLPDINELNAEAKLNAKAREKAIETFEFNGEPLVCECCGKPANFASLWFDIFSDDPKGIQALCKECEDRQGSPGEGYFECADCERVFIENYTWERYEHTTEDGDQLCLNCYFDRELRDESNWITDAAEICEARIRRAKHLIPVAGKHWENRLVFLGNAEFDSTDGHCISGSVDDLRDLARKGIEEHGKVILILDAAYQFAVSAALYAPKPEKKLIDPKSKKRSKKTAATKPKQMSRVPDMEGQLTIF